MRRRRFLHLAVGITVALGAASCSSDAKEATPATTTTVPRPTTTTIAADAHVPDPCAVLDDAAMRKVLVLEASDELQRKVLPIVKGSTCAGVADKEGYTRQVLVSIQNGTDIFEAAQKFMTSNARAVTGVGDQGHRADVPQGGMIAFTHDGRSYIATTTVVSQTGQSVDYVPFIDRLEAELQAADLG